MAAIVDSNLWRKGSHRDIRSESSLENILFEADTSRRGQRMCSILFLAPGSGKSMWRTKTVGTFRIPPVPMTRLRERPLETLKEESGDPIFSWASFLFDRYAWVYQFYLDSSRLHLGKVASTKEVELDISSFPSPRSYHHRWRRPFNGGQNQQGQLFQFED